MKKKRRKEKYEEEVGERERTKKKKEREVGEGGEKKISEKYLRKTRREK